MPENEGFYDFTHRDFRPDHKPIVIKPGIPLGPHEPLESGKFTTQSSPKTRPKPECLQGRNRPGRHEDWWKPCGGWKEMICLA